jgi:glycosyltransferase involved in cell wall biosynthesis
VKRPAFLIVCQVYPPDPASVGQHIADVAAEMVRRGYRVVVLTASRGYDDPSRIYPAREVCRGVEVHRLPFSSFGKSAFSARLLAQFLFIMQAVWHGWLVRGICGVLVSTVPPMCGLVGVAVGALRRVPIKYWVMDLNPDELVALGVLRQGSWPVRLVDACNRLILRAARDVVVLDRFMHARVCRKVDVGNKTVTMPPWPHADEAEDVPRAGNPFARQHVPDGAFAVMYSGNHSYVNPIRTLLDASERLQHDPRLLVLCVGGGNAKQEVADRIRRGATNIRSLPYQPLDHIRFSLSAADVHVVSLGDDLVGVVHPCKIYGAMAASRPILFLGPAPSHISELIDEHRIGWQVRQGDVDGMVHALQAMMALPGDELAAMGRRASAVVAQALSRDRLLGRFCDVMQRGLPTPCLQSRGTPPTATR